LFGEFSADAAGGGDFVGAGATEAGDAAEMLEEELFAVLGDAGAIVEEALGDAPFHEQLMVAVGEAMGFIADALEQLEGAAVFGEADGNRAPGAVNFFEFLGEADDGQFVQAEALEFAAGGAELAFSAIDDDEVGELSLAGAGGGMERGETGDGVGRGFLGVIGRVVDGSGGRRDPGFGLARGRFAEDAGVAAADDFSHAGKVVLAFDAFDAEAAVELVGGAAIDEADHAGDDVGGADIGDIEALHAAGRAAEGKSVAEGGEVGGGIDGTGDAETIAHVAGVAGHGFGGAAEVIEHVAQFGGALEIEGDGGLFHLVLEGLEQFLGFAGEEFAGALDAFAVLRGSDVGELHRHLVSGGFQLALGGSAPAEGQDAEFLAHESEGLAEGAGVGVGAKVAGVVVFFEAGEAEARPFVGHVGLDHEEAFVVAEADVVAGAEFLDEAAFEEEGFGLAAGDVPLEIPDAIEEGAGFEIGAHLAGGGEVLADALAEVAGFADVDDAIEAVPHEVDARLVGDIAEFDFRVGLFAEHG